MLLTLLFLIAAILAAVLLFTMVYNVIMFSDLEMDYKNPIQLCKQLNPLVIPEMAAHFLLTILFLLSGQFFSFLINLPLLAYHLHRWTSGRHIYEPTDIFRHLTYRKRELITKLIFFLITFFYYLFAMVSTLIHHQELASKVSKGGLGVDGTSFVGF